MTKVFIFGTQDTFSHVIRHQLLARDATLVLYLPKKNQAVTLLDPQRENIFQDDLLDLGRILRGMIGCEIVCLCEIPEPRVTWRIIEAMKLLDLTRLVCLVKPIEKNCLLNQSSEARTTHKKPRSSQTELSVRMIEESGCDYTFLHLTDFLHERPQLSDSQDINNDQRIETELRVADLLAQIIDQPIFLAKRTLFISNHWL